MRLLVGSLVAVVVVCLAPASLADLTPYSQDFEGLDRMDTGALAADGWLVFGNVFDSGGGYLYGYGPFPAPNDGAAFCAIVDGQGGPPQGAQQLSVYSDYNNGDHGNERLIESNTFQEQVVGPGDIGSTWVFKFDAKRGNIEGSTTALAFFKTIDPAAGFALTNFITIDMTNIPDTWGSYSLSISIDKGLVGQLLQFGFLNTATDFEGSGIFYDNVNFGMAASSVVLDIRPGSCPNPINGASRGVLPVAILGTDDFDVSMIDVNSLQLEGVAPLRWSYSDSADSDYICGCEGELAGIATSEGGDASGLDERDDLNLKFSTQDIIAAIGSPAHGEKVVLTLTGNLLDGTPIEAQDCVVGVGGGRDRVQKAGVQFGR